MRLRLVPGGTSWLTRLGSRLFRFFLWLRGRRCFTLCRATTLLLVVPIVFIRVGLVVGLLLLRRGFALCLPFTVTLLSRLGLLITLVVVFFLLIVICFLLRLVFLNLIGLFFFLVLNLVFCILFLIGLLVSLARLFAFALLLELAQNLAS